MFDSMSLVQMVDFPTWHRSVNGSVKSSTLDHVYCNDITIIYNLHSITPYMGDHSIIIFSINEKVTLPEPAWRQNWKNYNPDMLNSRLAILDWDIEANNVQDFWDALEHKLINVIDEIVPFQLAVNNVHQSENGSHFINNKLNKRKRLLKHFNNNKNAELKLRIKKLDKEIREYYYNKKKNSIRCRIKTNNNKSLWDAVKIAKNVNIQIFPRNLISKTTGLIRQSCQTLSQIFSEQRWMT